jgi:DegV family protein with EDD domain
MKPKVAIVTDSIACLPGELAGQYQLRVVPVNIHFNGRVYRDGVDITTEEAYRLLEEAPSHFASSPASIAEYLEAYRHTGVHSDGTLCFTLSSRLSTLYNMARLAKEEAEKEAPRRTIVVFDTGTAAVGEGLIVAAAARAAAEGKSLSEVIKVAEIVKSKVRVVGLMETIRYVYRTGRIPRFTAQAGSLLRIKPMFGISGGVVRLAGLTRSRESGMRRVLKMMRKEVGSSPVHVAVAHANEPEAGERLTERIASEFNCVELWLTNFSPVMGYATGKGTLAVAFYSDS